MTQRQLLLAANANFVASFGKLVEHSATGEIRDAGGVFAFVSGHLVSLFNGCVVAEMPSREQLAEAIDWVRQRQVSYRIWIAASLAGELGAVVRAAGLERDPVPYPNMVLHPVLEPRARHRTSASR